jgi:hypothetical protein
MVRYERSYLVRFYAVDGAHRARVTDVSACRSWTVADAVSTSLLEAQLVRDDRDHDITTDERLS